MIRPKIKLKKDRDFSVTRQHPWIFSGAIEKLPEELKDGDVVDVYTIDNRYCATGLYSGNSGISIKILSVIPINDLALFFEERIKHALTLRHTLGLPSNKTTAFRLINSEGDGLPGLIVDIYNETAVIEFHSQGMFLQKDLVANSLKSIFKDSCKSIFFRIADLELQNGSESSGYLFGKGENNVISENGNRFIVDWELGQKTGFFIDQRDNRAKLKELAGGKKILNAFSYTGGFSVYAAAGDAKAVTSVDSSENALKFCKENMSLNAFSVPHNIVHADCFQYLKSVENDFDIIVLDPPSFIKHRGAFRGGLSGYKAINFMALKLISGNGFLFTFSCSQLLSMEDFKEIVKSAGINSGKKLQIVEELGQAPCHPVSVFHPEGKYLKGLVVHVSD